MPVTKSILRYPGGKHNFLNLCAICSRLIIFIILSTAKSFCGGAGIAIELLLSGEVHSIILNDLDPAIYSIWNATINETDRFIDKIQKYTNYD